MEAFFSWVVEMGSLKMVLFGIVAVWAIFLTGSFFSLAACLYASFNLSVVIFKVTAILAIFVFCVMSGLGAGLFVLNWTIKNLLATIIWWQIPISSW